MTKWFSILFLFLSSGSFATIYYVSSSGNDFNPGNSVIGAWATISKVNSTQFLPGDALYFEGGKTFNGSINLTSADGNDPNNLFTISSYGGGRATINAGNSYGLYAYNTQGFSVSNLVFDGNATSTNTDAGIKVFTDATGDVKFTNISFSNIEVKNFGAEGIRISSSMGLTGYQNLALSNLSVHDVTKNGIKIFGNITLSQVGWQHKNVSVSNCELYNVPGSGSALLEGNGIVLAGVDGAVIQNCVAHDNGKNNINQEGPVGIWSLESNNVVIQFCESYLNHCGTGADGDGFDFDGGMTNSFLQYNYSHDNDGAGFLMGQYQNARNWGNNTMRYNISQNDATHIGGAIELFKGPGPSAMSGANIYNNTIYVSPQAANANISAVFFLAWTTGINQIAFYNNIFVTTGAVPLVNIPANYAAFFAGNIYYSSLAAFSINYQGVNYSSLSAWRTATSNEIVGGSNTGFSSDPLLTNPGLGGTVAYGNSLSMLNAYKIKNITSPAVDNGLNLASLISINAGSVDFWGNLLPGGSLNSIGSNQFSAALPIVLLAFYGNCSGSEQNIYWSTAEEINFKSFELLHSGNGVDFIKIADIPPTGSNSRYHYTNVLPSSGYNYYQLKMTDLDGTVTFSPVAPVNCGKTTDKITVFPNPFGQHINVSIESETEAPATITLFDALGKICSQKITQLQAGANQINVDGIDHLPAGAYYLQVLKAGRPSYFKLLKAAR